MYRKFTATIPIDWIFFYPVSTHRMVAFPKSWGNCIFHLIPFFAEFKGDITEKWYAHSRFPCHILLLLKSSRIGRIKPTLGVQARPEWIKTTLNLIQLRPETGPKRDTTTPPPLSKSFKTMITLKGPRHDFVVLYHKGITSWSPNGVQRLGLLFQILWKPQNWPNSN